MASRVGNAPRGLYHNVCLAGVFDSCLEREAVASDEREYARRKALSRPTPIFRHQTPDGEITADVRRLRDGVWCARLIGPTLDLRPAVRE